MSIVWRDILRSLDLSGPDQELANRFLEQNDSRLFLPVADVLGRYGLEEESLFLLMEGAEKHPEYTAGLVALAQSLFKRSLFSQAWETLLKAGPRLRGNQSALLLQFQLTLLFGLQEQCQTFREQLQGTRRGQAGFVDRLLQQLAYQDFEAVAEELKIHLENAGYDLSSLRKASTENRIQDNALERERHKRISGFSAMSLTEVFEQESELKVDLGQKDGLRAIDLAKIYRKQGQYEKAIHILKKLVYMSPRNDALQRQLRELRDLRAEQLNQEERHDPKLVANLNQIDLIEGRLKVLDRLLKELD